MPGEKEDSLSYGSFDGRGMGGFQGPDKVANPLGSLGWGSLLDHGYDCAAHHRPSGKFSDLGKLLRAGNTEPQRDRQLAKSTDPLDERGRFAYLTLAQHRNVVAAEACFITLWICTGIVEIRNGWLRRARKRSAPVHLK